MDGNSIKSNLTREDIVSEIKLSMGADIEGLNVYVILEGEDDVRFMHQYLADNVQIYESYDGKGGVEYIVCEYFSENERVVGIRDRDYQLMSASEKVFFYDYNCMEMMLISNENVFYKLCFEYYNGDMKYKQLKEFIFKQLLLMSIIRMHNERDIWGILLKGVSLAKAWNNDMQKLNEEMIINKINKMNNSFINAERRCLLKEEVEGTSWDEEDFYLYTQGHDFFVLFSTICNQCRKRGIKPNEVEASARCAFRMEDIIKTNLYKQILEYSKKNSLKILKQHFTTF